jgi:hypothetical protein
MACLLSACTGQRSRSPAESERVPSRAPEAAERAAAGERSRVTPYPAGRWRLASPEELERALLFGAHIQISHRDVTPKVASFHLPDWTPRTENPARTRLEALSLANDVAERARAEPGEFARIARELSDDVATRDLGGDLSGMNALTLTQWPELLDAFAALAEGEVSRVLETEFGFHVVLRHAPPAPEILSGARIIIGYDEAPWLQRYLARRKVPERSRAAALALARELHARLEQHPDEFAALVQRYSDHRDALRGGDFGEWSTHEVTPWFRELASLRAVAIGQVAPPLDSPFGVEILLRTPIRPRRTFTKAALELDFDPAAQSGAASSAEAARAELERLRARLRPDPSLFARERARSCCEAIETWVEGRGNPVEEAALAGLAPGEIAPVPIQVETFRMSLLQRLLPGSVSPVPALLELPRPAAPDVEWLASTYGDEALLTAVNERASAALALAADVRERLTRGKEAIRYLQAEGAEAKLAAFQDYQRYVESTLGAQRYASYRETFAQYLAERLLRVHPLAPARDPETGLPYSRWPLL